MYIHTFYIGSTFDGMYPDTPFGYTVPRYQGWDITFNTRQVWGVTPEWGTEQTLRVTSDQPMTDDEATDLAAMFAARYGQEQILVSREADDTYSRHGVAKTYAEEGMRTVVAPWHVYPVDLIGGYVYAYPTGNTTHAAWLVDSAGRETSLFD